MKIQPTTVMLLGFAGIVAYLIVTSAKKGPGLASAATGPALGQPSTAARPYVPAASSSATTTVSTPTPATDTPASQSLADMVATDFGTWAAQSGS